MAGVLAELARDAAALGTPRLTVKDPELGISPSDPVIDRGDQARSRRLENIVVVGNGASGAPNHLVEHVVPPGMTGTRAEHVVGDPRTISVPEVDRLPFAQELLLGQDDVVPAELVERSMTPYVEVQVEATLERKNHHPKEIDSLDGGPVAVVDWEEVGPRSRDDHPAGEIVVETMIPAWMERLQAKAIPTRLNGQSLRRAGLMCDLGNRHVSTS
ncbi:MAG: hypothetical protein AAGC60_23430 [Acidobacteriota bacterium]